MHLRKDKLYYPAQRFILYLLSCIHKRMLKTAFSPLHHFSGCNELFLNSQSSSGVQSSPQKKQLSSTHRFDIAKCILNHTNLTVKCLSPFVITIMETSLFHAFQKNFNMCSKLLAILEITTMGEKISYELYLVHKFWREKRTGEAKPQILMRLGFGLGVGVQFGVFVLSNISSLVSLY